MNGYHEELFQQTQAVVSTSDSRHLADRPGGVFVRKSTHMAEEDRVLLLAVARVVLVGDQGPLGTQIDVRERGPVLPARVSTPGRPRRPGQWRPKSLAASPKAGSGSSTEWEASPPTIASM